MRSTRRRSRVEVDAQRDSSDLAAALVDEVTLDIARIRVEERKTPSVVDRQNMQTTFREVIASIVESLLTLVPTLSVAGWGDVESGGAEVLKFLPRLRS